MKFCYQFFLLQLVHFVPCLNIFCLAHTFTCIFFKNFYSVSFYFKVYYLGIYSFVWCEVGVKMLSFFPR